MVTTARSVFGGDEMLPVAKIRSQSQIDSTVDSRPATKLVSLQEKAELRAFSALTKTGAISVLLVVICVLGFRAARHLIKARFTRQRG